MPILIGELVGSLFAIYLLYVLWEFVLFKRVFDDPVKGKICSVAAAYLMDCTMRGFIRADGGPFVWGFFLLHLFPALIVGAFAYRRGLALRQGSNPQEGLEATFS